MQPPRRKFLRLIAGMAASVAGSRIAWAQAYPARPVRVVVPFAPGGPTDIFARLVVQKLSEQLGKQFYIENVGGASGSIGTAQVAKAPPDGHTILFNVSSFAINPVFFGKVPYDPFKDFEPITLAATNDVVIVVHPSVPARTFAELVAVIKTGPVKPQKTKCSCKLNLWLQLLKRNSEPGNLPAELYGICNASKIFCPRPAMRTLYCSLKTEI